MGSYLSSPVKEKESENGVSKDGLLDYGASAMQGWRVSQEDAHVTLPEFDDNAMLFAVFDGHGGAEVAKYAAQYLGSHIKSLEKYKEGDFEGALVEGFLSFDELLRQPHVLEVLKAISKSSDSEDGGDGGAVDGGDSSNEDEEEDLENLLEEADEPIEDIIQRCGDAEEVKAILQKRIDMGRLLRAAVSKMDEEGKDDDDDSSDEEEEEDDDDEKEEKPSAGKDGVSQSSAGTKVRLDHLKEDGQSSGEDSTGRSSIGNTLSASNANTLSSTDSAIGQLSQGKAISKSVIIDDDAASASEAGPSSGEAAGPSTASASATTASSNGADDVEDTDYKPNDEIDSDDDEDDEDDWEMDQEATARAKMNSGRRMLLAPGMFEFGDAGHSVVPGFDSGATACLAFMKESMLYVANVGDSRCVVSQKGTAVEMSYDHKPEDPIETARIKKAGGKVTSDGRVNNGLNLSRALGDHNYKRNEEIDLSEQMISGKPDVKKLLLDSSHDFIVIACDGIWNSMSSQEVVDFVAQRLPKTPTGQLSRICEELFDAVIAPSAGGDGTGMDNCSAVIIRFRHQEDKPSVQGQANGQDEAHPVKGNGAVSLPLNGTQKRLREELDARDEKVSGDLVATSAKKIKSDHLVLNGRPP